MIYGLNSSSSEFLCKTLTKDPLALYFPTSDASGEKRVATGAPWFRWFLGGAIPLGASTARLGAPFQVEKLPEPKLEPIREEKKEEPKEEVKEKEKCLGRLLRLLGWWVLGGVWVC